jgi:biopolymer transport protein ExbB
LAGLTVISLALLQLSGLQGPDLTWQQQIAAFWRDGGWMMWPIGASGLIGLTVIVWKLIELTRKATRTRKFLDEVDVLINKRNIPQALQLARGSDSPAGRILAAGLERHDEGSERVLKAIENVGYIEMAALEQGLTWLATVSNVAPLMGFLGTVIGMIQAFQAIEFAGEVEATVVAAGIKVALITTAAGLMIAIPINVMHNYFVTRIDRLVVDMEESAQKMIDMVHAHEKSAAP